MKIDASRQLCQPYPLAARALAADSAAPFASYGIECGAGWAALITPVLEKVEHAARVAQEAGVAFDELPAIAQIKQEFGTLRIYVDRATPDIAAAISAAEQASASRCEQCGAAGVMRSNGWRMVLCPTHAAG